MARGIGFEEVLLNFSTLLFFLSLHSIAPFISRYAVSLGASEQEVAMLGPALSAVAIALRPFSGSLIDRGLINSLLMSGIALAMTSQIFYYFSNNTTLLYLGRGLQGVGTALFIPASIYTATLTSRNTASSLAWRSTMIGLSMTIGPAIGGVMASLYGYKSLFVTAIIYLAASGLLTTASIGNLKTAGRRGSGYLGDLLVKDYLTASFAILTYSIMYNCFLLFLPAYHSILHMEVAVTTAVFTTISIANLVSRIILSVMSSKMKYPVTAVIGFSLAFTGFTLIALDATSPYLMLYSAIAGLGAGLLIPSLQIVALLCIKERSRGMASGIYTAMFDAGNIVGPPVAIALGNTYSDALKISLGLSSSGLITLLVYNTLLAYRENTIRAKK